MNLHTKRPPANKYNREPEVVAAIKAGHKTGRISRDFSISQNTVRRIARSHGLRTAPLGRRTGNQYTAQPKATTTPIAKLTGDIGGAKRAVSNWPNARNYAL